MCLHTKTLCGRINQPPQLQKQQQKQTNDISYIRVNTVSTKSSCLDSSF